MGFGAAGGSAFLTGATFETAGASAGDWTTAEGLDEDGMGFSSSRSLAGAVSSQDISATDGAERSGYRTSSGTD